MRKQTQTPPVHGLAGCFRFRPLARPTGIDAGVYVPEANETDWTGIGTTLLGRFTFDVPSELKASV